MRHSVFQAHNNTEFTIATQEVLWRKRALKQEKKSTLWSHFCPPPSFLIDLSSLHISHFSLFSDFVDVVISTAIK